MSTSDQKSLSETVWLVELSEPIGEVIIGEDPTGLSKDKWTVVRWRKCAPPIAVGTKLYDEATVYTAVEALRDALAQAKGVPAVDSMLERAEMTREQLDTLPRKLLDVACRIRMQETLFRDDELVDQASHAIKGALAATLPSPAQASETAWLVEWKAHGYGPQWWGFNYEPTKHGMWCADANKAVRFARKKDAERMRLHIIAVAGLTGHHDYERSISVTEHEWCDD